LKLITEKLTSIQDSTQRLREQFRKANKQMVDSSVNLQYVNNHDDLGMV